MKIENWKLKIVSFEKTNKTNKYSIISKYQQLLQRLQLIRVYSLDAYCRHNYEILAADFGHIFSEKR